MAIFQNRKSLIAYILCKKRPYSELFRILSECGKMRTRIIPNADTFSAMIFFIEIVLFKVAACEVWHSENDSFKVLPGKFWMTSSRSYTAELN